MMKAERGFFGAFGSFFARFLRFPASGAAAFLVVVTLRSFLSLAIAVSGCVFLKVCVCVSVSRSGNVDNIRDSSNTCIWGEKRV